MRFLPGALARRSLLALVLAASGLAAAAAVPASAETLKVGANIGNLP